MRVGRECTSNGQKSCSILFIARQTVFTKQQCFQLQGISQCRRLRCHDYQHHFVIVSNYNLSLVFARGT